MITIPLIIGIAATGTAFAADTTQEEKPTDQIPEQIPMMPMHNFDQMPMMPMHNFDQMPMMPMHNFDQMPMMPMHDFDQMPNDDETTNAIPVCH
ncbi:hypothetical protein [Methanonatronarchaeum sp. AMET6-2]|uniref:hypothetical protein n=1 Tax=Methanonatronarchaeum sp. AMET6-2 TaxID=2933293 RepID=UPI001FF24178|nr:hypothetical protein [Methanonatronarchaeum sp. AMET6-2]UOY10059.1 hypothetical protein MU439_07320 [Methanonatronarchaeum sp. AMET6-2]